ncbi:MAG: ABC transporter transmembrane domain-containing protein [Pseudomonadota bacterium]
MNSEPSFAEQNKPLDKRLLRYVWQHTRRDQIWVIFVILASMPTYFFALDLPKQIINQPIQGVGFEDATATATFMRLAITPPSFLSSADEWVLFGGFDMERLPFLMALSLTFLSLVCINGLFKFYINTYKGRLGERMLRRMRYDLVDRVLRFPIYQFRRVKASEIASMVKDEVEPFGEFIGDAFVLPVFLGGQAIIAFTFIMLQSFWLGMMTIATISVQMVLIPYLRKRVLELGRQRQLTARQLSGRIGEIVEGITAVHVNDTSNYERSEISSRLGKIFFIRFELYQRKFFVKFINNFLAQLTPFLFYVVGGYFAIRGTLDIGQLVAVIAAYKELPTPINGLIVWDQKRLDINIKYAQIVEQFNVNDLQDAEQQALTKEPVAPLKGEVVVSNLVVEDETASVLIEDADFIMKVNDVVAVVGPLGSGAGAMAETLAGLREPTQGRMLINGSAMNDLPEAITGRRLAYVGSESYLPQQTLLNTLLYASKHQPIEEKEYEGTELTTRNREIAEAISSGNSQLDINANWIDFESMGATSFDDVHRPIMEVLKTVELDNAVYELAMRQTLDPELQPELCEKLIDVRHIFRERLEGSDIEQFVEPFDAGAYNQQATIAENLLFGTAADETLAPENLAGNEYVQQILNETGLDRLLFEMGIELAETAIELFADLSPDNPFFEQLNFMSPELLEDYPPILARVRQSGLDGAGELDRKMLIMLPFSYVEPRNRLGLLKEEHHDIILKARNSFRENLPDELSSAISLYAADEYNDVASVQDNILLGRIAHGFSDATEKVQQAIKELLDELGLNEEIFKVGLSFDIGTAGKRLSETQRQKVALARTLLKRADLVIINRGINTLDSRAQERIVKRLVTLASGKDGNEPFGLLWVLMTPSYAREFDRVLVFDRGRLVEKGSHEDLLQSGRTYAELVS